ncbi:MAG: hypothetical protein ABSC94_30250 [Polyangiaceae bacterium]|jgi:hypothetical protein
MGTRSRVIFVTLFGAALAFAPGAGAGGYVVLVNASNQVTSLSHSELKHVVLGATKQWSNGAVVQVGIIPGDAPETQYFGSLLDLTPRELLARIQEAVFKGELRRPAVLRSSADCVAMARAGAGAICVASDGEALPPEVHVVTVH